MTLPDGVAPSGPTEAPAEAPVEPTPEAAAPAPEPVAEEDPVLVDDPETAVDESSSDADLRAWARDNGIEDVPASGRLSAAWREQILAAMTAALDPKDEVSAEASSPESSTSVETTTETTEDGSPGTEDSASTEPPAPIQPEFDNPYGEYRSVFKAPDTFMTTQV